MDLKLNNINGVGVVNAPVNNSEIKNEAENTSKDTLELTKENEAKSDKHVVSYIGNSEFIDSKGHKWHKNDEQTYADDEYSERKDLHFMVKYGEMKHTVVTM
jgi:hypothetical protein